MQDYRQTLWFHGTDAFFDSWQVPPPPKPGEDMAVAHTALFFSSNERFAAAAGQTAHGLCSARIHTSARVLDATKPSQESETLRQQVAKNELASLGHNINNSLRWTQGWNTGETLRFSTTAAMALPYIAKIAASIARHTGLPSEAAIVIAKHNCTRGLIELICVEARKLGFDAIVGHEVDQTAGGQRLAMPWLAVLSADAITPVEWLRRPGTAQQ